MSMRDLIIIRDYLYTFKGIFARSGGIFKVTFQYNF